MFQVSKYMIPHPEKAFKGGEDAYFTNQYLLSVADGVGGWASQGVDPGKYSKLFCKNVGELYAKNADKYKNKPKNLIIDSHTITKEIGSTTACIATIDQQQPIIYTSYIGKYYFKINNAKSFLGDSGYVIYRQNKKDMETIYISQEQQKQFNFPYQIGSEGDKPQKSLEFQHQIENNDIIILGTDGLFDNIDTTQILNCIKPFFQNQKIINLDKISETVAKYAFKLSLDPYYNSPFSKKAKENYLDFYGGKSDDITVVVAQIKLYNNL